MTQTTRQFQGPARRVVCCLPVLAAVLMAAVSGCEDVDWLWWQGTGKQKPPAERRIIRRPSPAIRGQRPVPEVDNTEPPPRPESDDAFADDSSGGMNFALKDTRADSSSPFEDTPPPAPAPRSDTTVSTTRILPEPAAAPPDDEFYQVLLLSEPSTAQNPSNIRTVNLKYARAGDVGALLEQLFIPVGPGGSENRYFLIYESVDVWTTALGIAPQLDVAASPNGAGGSGAKAGFDAAVAMYYAVYDSPGRRRSEAATLVDKFNVAIVNTSLPAPLQWVAAMAAGHIATDWMQDTDGAIRYYTLAQHRAVPRSPAQLMASVRLADVYERAGRNNDARKTYEELLSACAAHSDAFAYRQAHGRATKLGSKR